MKRFSVREILLLFVIVALILGWWYDKSSSAVRYQVLHHAAGNMNRLYILDTVTGKVSEAKTGKYVDTTTGEVKEIE